MKFKYRRPKVGGAQAPPAPPGITPLSEVSENDGECVDSPGTHMIRGNAQLTFIQLDLFGASFYPFDSEVHALSFMLMNGPRPLVGLIQS